MERYVEPASNPLYDGRRPEARGASSVANFQPSTVNSSTFPRQSTFKIARNASCGISTLPTIFMRFFPSFCFSSSLRFLEMSPP
jgi:hypothetical protein